MPSKTRSRQLTQHSRTAQRRTTQSASSGRILSAETLRAYLYTLAIGAGLILLLSLGAYFHSDPASIIHPLAYLAAALTSFFGGLIAKKLCGSAPTICGLINGILLTCTMLLLSFFFLSESSEYSALVSALLHTAVPVLSVLGALAGVKKKSAYTSKKRRYLRRS